MRAMRRSLNSLAGLWPAFLSLIWKAATSMRRARSRPGRTGDGDVGDGDAEDFDEFLLHADAVDVGDVIPGFEGDDEVEDFSTRMLRTPEHGGDVDDADAADFHVVAGGFGAGADDLAAVDEGHAGGVVGDEAVAAFDEGEDALAFADAAFRRG